MVSTQAKLYKNATFSDTNVRIRQLQPCAQEAASSSPAAKRQRTTHSNPEAGLTRQQQGLSPVLVEEFPGHRAVLFIQAEYFATKSGWDQLQVVSFDVEEHQVTAAQALVYGLYHDGSLMPGMQLEDVVQLLLLADQYQAPACTAACIQQLKGALQQGKDCDAGLQVIAVLGQLGSVSPAVAELFECFKEWRESFRATFAGLVTKPCWFLLHLPNEEQGPAFNKAVAILQIVFKDMDAVWGQQGFQHILALFPLEVVHAVLRWDGLCCVSENVIVAAIHLWLEAQPGGDKRGESRHRVRHEAFLLHIVRIPHLSPTYLTQIFPKLPWVQSRLSTAQMSRATYLAVTGVHKHKLQNMDPVMQRLAVPRQYQPAMPPFKLHCFFPWAELHAARLQAEAQQDSVELLSPDMGWVNGFAVVVQLFVQPYENDRVCAVQGCWFWKHLEGSAQSNECAAIVSFNLQFDEGQSPVPFDTSSCAASGRIAVQERQSLACNSAGLGYVELWNTYPAAAEQLAAAGHKVHATLTITEMQ